jgi:hypothetical protein
MKALLGVASGLLLLVTTSSAQRTEIVPWAADPATPSPAYRPEPILFVHGINANDSGWSIDEVAAEFV